VIHEVRVRIRWRDLDAYGHVNNAVYLNYLEECRDRMVQDLFGEHVAWDFVLAHVEVDFRRQLTQDDEEVVVRCTVASVGRSSVRTSEQILTTDGTLAAEASSVIVPRDPDGNGSRALTENERAVLVAEMASAASSPVASDDATPVDEVVAVPAVADPHDRDAADAAG
jgi:acyl-CoA thioester hydrolase